MGYEDRRDINVLIGKTLKECKQGRNKIRFLCEDGSEFQLFHNQDCCESVEIESITGDLYDLIGHPILLAEESSSNKNPEGVGVKEYEPESFTWTFYKFATIKGYVDIRWYGSSNGYYSEKVNFEQVR